MTDPSVARFAVAAVGLAVAMAALALPWWPSDSQPTRLAVGVVVAGVGLAALVLLLRLWRERRAETRALEQFTQRLRAGDVGGALRAVHVDSRLSPAGPDSQPAGARSTRPMSRFDLVAQDVETALGEREQRWQARMKLSADWHWETDADMRFTWVSRDLASLSKLGVQPADLIGRRIDALPLFQPPDEGWAMVNERLAQQRPVRELMLEMRRPGRLPVWVALNGRAHRDAQGRFAGYEGVGRDITEQRLAWLRLVESERRHTLMAELSSDWYWQTDAQHRIEQFGPVARALLGDRAAEAVGRTRWDLHAQGLSDEGWAAHRADLDARRPFRDFEFAVRHPGRGLRWVAISGQPRIDDRGIFLGYHGAGRDVTLSKRAERMLLHRNQELERLVGERTAELEHSNRDLEAFSRQLAHELRTPIGQVAGLSDLLKGRAWDRLDAEEREWLRLQGQAAREMSHTLTALLELARSASTALLLEPVDLSALAKSVIDDLPWLERKAPLEWVIEPGLQDHCSAALARVVLTNLLGNAAKFTRDVPEPRIEFRRHSASAVGGFVVRDNGAGFDAGRAAALFQPFVRLHRSEQFQGTGLGLSIVRRIVERHGGSISAVGMPGRGASFSFYFSPPRQAAVDSTAQTTDRAGVGQV